MRLPRLASTRLLYCVFLVGFSVPPTALATELKVSVKDLHFGTVIVGQTRSLSTTLTNTSAKAVKISSIQSSDPVFVVSHDKLPFTLKAGRHVALEIRFRPVAVGHIDGRIVVDKTAASLGVHGRGVKAASNKSPKQSTLKANPSSLTFGNVQVGNSAELSMVLTNSGSSSISISEGRIPTGFSLAGLSTPLTLEAGQSFTFSVEFAPQTTSTVSGDLTFVDHKSEAVGIMLRGTGTAAGHLGDTPATMGFGNVTVGKSASLSGTLSATDGSVTVDSVASSSPEFVVSGISFPVTIAAGNSVHYTVNFTPQQSGTAVASLSFASSASDSQVSESLTGSGVGAGANQSVVLSWNPSASQVVGYNVYRSGQSGGPYAKINSAVNKGTTYTDTSVTAGETYYYVIAAVSSSGQQSTYSNQAQAAIP